MQDKELPSEFQNLPEDIKIEMIGGYCPYQINGTICGIPFYFRSRGQRWSLSIDRKDPLALPEPEWFYRKDYPGEPGSAGWIDDAEARRFFDEAVSAWRETPADHPTRQPI